MQVALYAALAMVLQDILGVLRTQAEARNREWLSAHFDSLMYFTVIATNTISVTAFQGHNTGEKILVVVLVTIGNYIGSILGVKIGRRFIKEVKPKKNKRKK